MNMPLNLTILPQVLKQAGYQTHAIGKWDVCCLSLILTSR
jgi:arylsulfatase A-like enzyme